MRPEQIKQISDNGGIYKFFKIEKKLKLNINVYDHNNLLCKYDNIRGIFEYFFKYTTNLLFQNGQVSNDIWSNDSFLIKYASEVIK
jgi:hypothetical protein